MKKKDLFLEKFQPKRHRYYELLRARRSWLPQCVVATFVGVSNSRISQILRGHAPCPSWIDDELDELVRTITILEDNDGRGGDA